MQGCEIPDNDIGRRIFIANYQETFDFALFLININRKSLKSFDRIIVAHENMFLNAYFCLKYNFVIK